MPRDVNPPAAFAVGAAIVMAMLTAGPVAKAEGAIHRTVGDYEIAVRYKWEPVHTEEANAIVIEIKNRITGAPVIGAEATLGIRGTLSVASNPRPFRIDLFAAPNQPGVYEAVIVPPAAGEYTYEIVGAIDSTPVDEFFTTGDGLLPPVVSRGGLDYGESGSRLALGILGAYLVGLAVLLLRMRSRRRAGAVG